MRTYRFAPMREPKRMSVFQPSRHCAGFVAVK